MHRYAIGVAALAGVCVSVFFGGCQSADARKVRPEQEAKPVLAIRVEPRNLSQDTVLSAEFKPFQEVEVHAKVAGYVKKMYVDVGSHVKAGQTLATLEIPEFASDLARARAATLRAKAEVERAKGDIGRAQASYDAAHLLYTRLAGVAKERPNLVAQQEIDQAQSRDLAGENSVAAAKAALAAALQQQQAAEAEEQRTQTVNAYSVIMAPFAGVVSTRYADTGAMIQAGTASQTQAMPVVRLSQLDLLRLVVYVPESLVPQVRPGAKVSVHVSAIGRDFAGRVARVSSRLNEQSRTMETEIDVPNPSLSLVPGMFAQVRFPIACREDVLTLPVESVITSGKQSSVMRISGGVIHKQAVETGIATEQYVEIRAGLDRGDLVAGAGLDSLKDGELVIPREIAR